jgi:hypothetical protein
MFLPVHGYLTLSSKQPNSVRNCLAKYEEWPQMMIKQTFAEENAVSEILMEGWTRKKFTIVFRLKKIKKKKPICGSNSYFPFHLSKISIIKTMPEWKVFALNLMIFIKQI